MLKDLLLRLKLAVYVFAAISILYAIPFLFKVDLQLFCPGNQGWDAFLDCFLHQMARMLVAFSILVVLLPMLWKWYKRRKQEGKHETEKADQRENEKR